jgi:hypothetical protein
VVRTGDNSGTVRKLPRAHLLSQRKAFNTEFASGESRIPMCENGVEWGE